MAEIIVKVDTDIMELIPGFMENRKKNIATINEAIIGNDWETVYQVAHKIKGSAGLYGLTELSSLAKELEFAGKEKNADKAIEYFKKIEEYVANLKIVSK